MCRGETELYFNSGTLAVLKVKSKEARVNLGNHITSQEKNKGRTNVITG